MTSQKDDLVDRRKVEAWQHVEPKRTKHGNMWSRSVLTEALPFYVLLIVFMLA